MNRILVLVFLLLATQAQAAVFGIVQLRSGAHLRFHDSPGICVHGALLVEYVAPGKPVLAGCWTRAGDVMRVVFLDGDSGDVPIEAVKRPEMT